MMLCYINIHFLIFIVFIKVELEEVEKTNFKYPPHYVKLFLIKFIFGDTLHCLSNVLC